MQYVLASRFRHVFLKRVMTGEQIFCELELRWVRELRTTRNPKLQACAEHAARRERELLAILSKYPAGIEFPPPLPENFPLPQSRGA